MNAARHSLSSAELTSLREPLPLARLLRAYLMEAKVETLAALRTVSFAPPFVILPPAIYFLFGVVIFGSGAADADPAVADWLFASFAAMGAMMPGIFGGTILATEREGRLTMLKRALPQPPGASIIAKILTAMLISAIAVILVAIVALIAQKITLSPVQVGIVCTMLIAGSIPFTAIGLLIGACTSTSASIAWSNLVFLPMLWLSGLFIPLPAFLKSWVVIWPAFHLNQLALGAAGVAKFTFIPPAMAFAVLAGVTVLFGGLAMRRLARVG